ncbi:maltose excess protein 1, chloroplastic isoform X2 [Gossypium raimondii]|uniref:maltose excess protein 1, chloroplastic isoform X2 n=1 Tax=Gossypium raimondii TaxID=29730 RepID=UPI00227C4F90|nr:maltose excess protein 1, chloroplastic isoform X2 [Gossypium raimondii]
MADSLSLPIAPIAANYDHSSLLSRNSAFSSRLLPFKCFSSGKNKLNLSSLGQYSFHSLHHRVAPIRALDSDVPHPLHKGMLTGLLGNLSLLSYFAKKKEKEAAVVQTLGVLSTYVVISQLAMAEAMPLPHFMATSVVVGSGLILNLLNYYNILNRRIWQIWEDFITVGGLSVLPQIMWSTFVPYIPNSILPGAIAFILAVAAVTMAHTGKLSEKGVKFVGAISGWTATLLFMWMPVSQMWTNFLNPDNIKGLSAISMLLAMTGNGLMIPRALFIRDFMWFTGSTWGTVSYGYANIVCLYIFNSIGREFFIAATVGLISWLGITLWRDTVVHEYESPIRTLKELVFGS